MTLSSTSARLIIAIACATDNDPKKPSEWLLAAALRRVSPFLSTRSQNLESPNVRAAQLHAKTKRGLVIETVLLFGNLSERAQAEAQIGAVFFAASVIGVGLYGVDLKQVGDRCYVIEVNDNPNIDAGNEDGVLKEALYREVLGVFLRRIRERGKPVEA